MAYITAANLRPDTLAEFAWGLGIDTTTVPLDATITSAITRISTQFDDWCNDHFSTVTETLELNGSGTSRLLLPKRCTAVTTVKTRDYAGTLTTQATTVWRFTSSLDSTGATRIGGWDYIDVVPGQYLTGLYDPYAQYSSVNYTELTWPSVWPMGPQMVQVAVTSGWTVTPSPVQKAIAILVNDHFNPPRGDLRRADRWQTADVSVSVGRSEPSGLKDVDDIIAEYKRDSRLGIA